MAHNASNFSLFQTVYSLWCLTSILTSQALLLHVPKFPCERCLGLIFAFFVCGKHICCFFISFLFEDVFTISGKFSDSLAMIVEAYRILHFLSPQEFKQKWYDLACLLTALVLLAKFILSTQAVHDLLADFAEPVITLVR